MKFSYYENVYACIHYYTYLKLSQFYFQIKLNKDINFTIP